MTTPSLGPWKVVIDEQPIGEPLVSVVDAEGYPVCNNETYYPAALDPKNAHLIAAAPELLAAVYTLIDCCDHTVYGGAVRYARAATAKARGEE